MTVAGDKPLAGYKPDQGRYMRMAAFWSLFAFWGLGCYRLRITLQSWFSAWFPQPRFPAGLGDGDFINVPLVGGVNLAVIVALVVFGVGVYVIHRVLNRPKIADLLIETQDELRKVTWPSREETLSASMVVIATVVILVGFLWVADILLAMVAKRVMG